MRDYPVPAREELHKLWERFDYNGNGLLSLVEIDKLVREEYPQYDDKQALLRAYKFADQDGSGFITKNEFATLVRSLAYFKALARNLGKWTRVVIAASTSTSSWRGAAHGPESGRGGGAGHLRQNGCRWWRTCII